jgi:hypothetical protein
VGLLVCAAFVGVAVTPENSMMNLHVQLTFWAFRLFPLAAILFALAAMYSDTMSKQARMAWWILAADLAIYMAVMTWGPSASTDVGLPVQVIAQKVITIASLCVLVALTLEGDKALRA